MRFIMLVCFHACCFCVSRHRCRVPGYYDRAVESETGCEEELVLVDARTREEYEQSHISGAENINEKNFDCEALKLPVKKSTPFVIYCNGVKCGKSGKIAQKIGALGYTNLAIYGRVPVWEERSLPLVTSPDYGKKDSDKHVEAVRGEEYC